MPSFPLSAGFMSFFSWKGEDKAAKTIYNATSETAKAANTLENENSVISEGEEEEEGPRRELGSPIEQQTGFMSSLMGYFSKGGGTKQKQDDNQTRSGTKEDMGIITWDPLKEQTREQLLALRDDLDRTLNTTAMDNLVRTKRPPMRIRSKTFNVAEENSLYSSSLEQNSDGSVLDKTVTSRTSSTSSMMKETERIPLRKTMTENPKRQHLVEVLGIDGVRVDSFERAQVNFDKHEEKRERSSEEKEDELNGSGGDNLWLDLNNELNKPGPAITSPGESRADVAQDATIPKESNNIEDKKDLEQEEINKLPGQCRMDYVLQPDSVMSMIANEYLIGLRAHFSYWTNKDLLWHMLRRIENLKVPSDEIKNPSVSTSDKTAAVVSIDERNIQKKQKPVKK